MKSAIILLACFFATASAVTFNCWFTLYSRVWITDEGVFAPVDSAYTCIADNFQLTGDPNLTGFEGEHVPGFTDNDVEVVRFGIFNLPEQTCEHLTFIPQGVDRFFPNVGGFFYWQCSILSLQGNEFDSYRNLRQLEIAINPLSHVPGQLLQQNRNLFYVSFLANRINSVGTGLIDNLPALSFAIFLDNICISSAVFNNPLRIRYLSEELERQCVRRDILSELVERLQVD